MDANFVVSAGPALVGALVGAAASLMTTLLTGRAQSRRDRQVRADALRQASFGSAQILFQTFVDVEREFRDRERTDSLTTAGAVSDSVWTVERLSLAQNHTALLSEEWARVDLFNLAEATERLKSYAGALGALPLGAFAELAGHGRLVVSSYIRGEVIPPSEPVEAISIVNRMGDEVAEVLREYELGQQEIREDAEEAALDNVEASELFEQHLRDAELAQADDRPGDKALDSDPGR